MRIHAISFVLVAAWSTRGAAAPEVDGRDYDRLSPASTEGNFTISTYLREWATTAEGSASTAQGIFRGSWELTVHNVAVVPVDLSLPVEDRVTYGPAAQAVAGVGNLTEQPTLAVFFPIDTVNHAYLALSGVATLPVGSYDDARTANVGHHRWGLGGRGAAGLHFGPVTLEIVAGSTAWTDNTRYLAPGAGTTQNLAQNPTTLFSTHFTLGVSPNSYLGMSYYFTDRGSQSLDDGSEVPTQDRNALRFTYAITFARTVQLLLQLHEGIASTNGAAIWQFFGLRVSHTF